MSRCPNKYQTKAGTNKHHFQSRDNTFFVKPINRFSKEFPFFRKPAEFGHFSLDGKRRFHHDATQLRHYVPPKTTTAIKFDLRKGYDTRVEKDDDIVEGLTHLLNWICLNKEKFKVDHQEKTVDEEKAAKNNKTKLNTDFISWRGHFTKFLCTPYENCNPWKMAVTLFNGTIYICEVETEKARDDRLNRSARQKEMCYWGYKFEDYVTQSVDEVDSADIVNTNEAYCSVVRTRLSMHSILFGAEVDCCVKGAQTKPPDNYIELKTTRIMDNDRQEMSFARFKLKKFWAQSFLAGVPKIIVGLRDDDGIVRDMKDYNTKDIPKICKQYHNTWDANICMNFLDSLLTWLKEIVIIDDVNTAYMLSFDFPFEKLVVDVCRDGSERFLPVWFVNRL